MKRPFLIIFLITSILFAQENNNFTKTKKTTTQKKQIKIKEHNKILVIGTYPNEKRYKLQSEKLWKRWNIPITKAYINQKGEAILIYKHPITKITHKTSIRKKNVQKIIKGSRNNKKEIVVENLDGKNFYLVKIK